MVKVRNLKIFTAVAELSFNTPIDGLPTTPTVPQSMTKSKSIYVVLISNTSLKSKQFPVSSAFEHRGAFIRIPECYCMCFSLSNTHYHDLNWILAKGLLRSSGRPSCEWYAIVVIPLSTVRTEYHLNLSSANQPGFNGHTCSNLKRKLKSHLRE